VALLAREFLLGRLDALDIVRVVSLLAASFLACHLLIDLVFAFDAWDSFRFALADAQEFNATMCRPYHVWIVHNVKDFLFGAGLASSAVYLAWTTYLLGRVLRLCGQGNRNRLRNLLVTPESLLTLSLSLVLVTIDVIGVNRGETMRLWIFLAVFVQIIV